jgi:hypothetical protein
MAYKKDIDAASEQWARYVFCRDNGHRRFVEKADRCDNFFAGNQWSQSDLDKLASQRRPALTINKILSTLSTVLGFQIQNRAEVTFLPQRSGTAGVADALVKVWQHIAYNNQMQWTRSDVFCDGLITSRGFYDVRLEFDDSMQGEVRVGKPNPKNVVIDPDAEEYDPDTWSDVITTRWMTPDQIAVLYGEEAANELKAKDASCYLYGYDSLDHMRDRMSGPDQVTSHYALHRDDARRYIRVLDRQYRKLTKSRFFVDPTAGDMRRVPDGWVRDKIAAVREKYQLEVLEKWERRPFWCTTAEDLVLHDDWSPYKRFTIVPYFPYFRHGRTIGLVENLLGAQELLNKTTSQELHVINTTANSGWKVKTGALSNMSVEDLEERGAETGLVLELDEVDSAEKIQPNQIPTGLERLSYKAEEMIKGISNVSDSMQGFDREDVAAKAMQQKRQQGGMNFSKVLDNLERSDYFLARSVLDIVQDYYTEPRILNIIRDPLLGETEAVEINTPDETGAIVNDLTLGEYTIIVTTAPYRASIEDSQFEQATALRELGVPIPDSVLIENSRLLRKREIVKAIEAQTNTPEAQAMSQLQVRGVAADVSLKEAQTQKTLADAQAKTDSSAINAAKLTMTPGQDPQLEREKAEAEHALEVEKQDKEFALEERKLLMKEQLDADAHAREQAREDERMQNEALVARAQAVAAARAPQQQTASPSPKPKTE